VRMRVRFAVAALPLLVIGLGETAWAGRHVTAEPGEEVSDGLIVHLRQGARLAGAKVPARYMSNTRWRPLRLSWQQRVQVDPADQLSVGAALAEDPAVELVEPDRIRRVALVAPNDPRFAEQWNLTRIRARQAWQWFPGQYNTSTLNLTRARVAVLDTGADCTHPDFANAGGTSSDSAQGGQLNWSKSVAFQPTTITPSACPWEDDHGHGTVVAGIVGAATHNQTGVASLGAMLELAIYKIARANGGSSDSDMSSAIIDAADKGARVITISLSGPGFSQILQDACDYAWAHNSLVVAATGNSGVSTLTYPSANNHVITVGAFDTNGVVASFSNRGLSVDVTAPGVSILSTARVAGGRYEPSYAAVSGTSMAAPHVAALAGLLTMAAPEAVADAIMLRIQQSADLDLSGWSSDLGYGRIDAERAITGAGWRNATLGGAGGQIQDPAGLGLAGATVTLNSTPFTTLAGGFFRFTNIAPGDYTMTVSATGQTTLNVPVTVAGGADTPTHLRLGLSYGILRGTVTLDGAAAAGMVVTARQAAEVRASAIANANGQYRLYVPAGTYEVRTGGMFAGVATASGRTVAAGGDVSIAPLAATSYGRLEGTIRNASNGAVPEAQVLPSAGGRSFGAVSGASGGYRTIPGLAGVYEAKAEEASAGASTPASVSIVNGITGRLDMVLRTSAQRLTLSPETAAYTALGGSGSAVIAAGSSTLVWRAASDSSWLTAAFSNGSGSGTLSYTVAPNPGTAARTGRILVNEAILTVTQTGATASVTVNPDSASFTDQGGTLTANLFTAGVWVAVSEASWLTVGSPAAGAGNAVLSFSASLNSSASARTGRIGINGALLTVTQAGGPPPGAAGGLYFVPVRPCRLVDTRENLGPFGRPALAGGVPRSFVPASASCGIPGSAKAYALNVTVVPRGPLGYITIFPTGQAQPLVSTLNSVDGRVKANAAIVAAGTGGAISVTATDATELVLDILGYFADPGANSNALAFYPVTPCRVADTRNQNGGLGGPILAAGVARSMPILSSGCGIPATAQAYSINATVVPSGPLGYLTLWPSGQSQPFVSTLNAPTGAVVANAAIVPAGAGGAINAFATDASHLVIDINGYFAPPGASNAQRFFPVSPCRVLDTRDANAALGGPILSGGQARPWPIPSSSCGLPAAATAYSLNATAVPTAGLGFLSMWPAGRAQPLVSTLNASDDRIVANAAIVAAGSSGAIATFATSQTHLVLDTNGYFAP
jgi:thermitase